MPIGCIFGDPFVFGSFQNGSANHLNPYAIACYTFIAWQIAWLGVSWVVDPDSTIGNSFISGTLLAGTVFALLIAVMLTPVTLIGSFFLLGLIGVTPWLTGVTFLRTSWMHRRRATQVNYIVMFVGFILPIAIASAVMVATMDFEIGHRDPNMILF